MICSVTTWISWLLLNKTSFLFGETLEHFRLYLKLITQHCSLGKNLGHLSFARIFEGRYSCSSSPHISWSLTNRDEVTRYQKNEALLTVLYWESEHMSVDRYVLAWSASCPHLTLPIIKFITTPGSHGCQNMTLRSQFPSAMGSGDGTQVSKFVWEALFCWAILLVLSHL